MDIDESELQHGKSLDLMQLALRYGLPAWVFTTASTCLGHLHHVSLGVWNTLHPKPERECRFDAMGANGWWTTVHTVEKVPVWPTYRAVSANRNR